MLAPKRVKFRKVQKGRMRGAAYRGSDVSFGVKVWIFKGEVLPD